MDQPDPDPEDEASSGSDVSSIFSEASSKDSDRSIDTTATEDEVDTPVLEQDGVIPDGEALFSDEHSWSSPPIFQCVHSCRPPHGVD